AALTLLVACGESGPAPQVTAVTPRRGYTDRELRLQIDGAGFLPAYRIDPASGQRIGEADAFSGRVHADGDEGHGGVLLRDFGWRGPTQLSATMDPGLPAGPYSVSITDPRGRTAVLPAAFTALGPDQSRPRIAFHSPAPDALVAPGMKLPVRLGAEDDAPG